LEHWYAVFTKPRAEAQACSALLAKGVEVYLPTVRVQPVNPRARKLLPFFPRYLFVHTDLAEIGISALNWTPGVAALVTIAGQPVTVPPEVIEALRKRVAHHDQARPVEEVFRHGERVLIDSGPMRGVEAVFDARLDGKARARVLVDFLRRQVAVDLDVQQLQRIDPRALKKRQRK
jgi:transcription elongation factor/antiterminator RfaH